MPEDLFAWPQGGFAPPAASMKAVHLTLFILSKKMRAVNRQLTNNKQISCFFGTSFENQL
ncbi:hypothetical protein LI291_11030 [Intestinibacillus massiliensis]|nr:hypothetical protein [Intestinibacillus massiliensis]